MVENQIIQLPSPKGDLAMFANLKLRNRMLLGYAVPLALKAINWVFFVKIGKF